MIYKMLPCSLQRMIDDEPELSVDADVINCCKKGHTACVQYLVQTRDFNRIYYCMFDKHLLNQAIENRHLELFKFLVDDVVKNAKQCRHGFHLFFALKELNDMVEGAEKDVLREYISRILEHSGSERPTTAPYISYYDPGFESWECKRRRIN